MAAAADTIPVVRETNAGRLGTAAALSLMEGALEETEEAGAKAVSFIFGYAVT